MTFKVTKAKVLSTLAAATAVFVFVAAWQTSGAWFPASVAQVQKVSEYGGETRLLFLYAELRELRVRAEAARVAGQVGFYLELMDQIEEHLRLIAVAKKERGIGQ